MATEQVYSSKVFSSKKNVFFLGKKALAMFTNLKKRYMRKKNALKVANRSGTSREAVENAERAIKPYSFLSWMDSFIQL